MTNSAKRFIWSKYCGLMRVNVVSVLKMRSKSVLGVNWCVTARKSAKLTTGQCTHFNVALETRPTRSSKAFEPIHHGQNISKQLNSLQKSSLGCRWDYFELILYDYELFLAT